MSGVVPDWIGCYASMFIGVSKIKRIFDPRALRSQRVVCTLVFAPREGVWTAPRKVAHRLRIFPFSFQASEQWRQQCASMRTPLFVHHDARDVLGGLVGRAALATVAPWL